MDNVICPFVFTTPISYVKSKYVSAQTKYVSLLSLSPEGPTAVVPFLFIPLFGDLTITYELPTVITPDAD